MPRSSDDRNRHDTTTPERYFRNYSLDGYSLAEELAEMVREAKGKTPRMVLESWRAKEKA